MPASIPMHILIKNSLFICLLFFFFFLASFAVVSNLWHLVQDQELSCIKINFTFNPFSAKRLLLLLPANRQASFE